MRGHRAAERVERPLSRRMRGGVHARGGRGADSVIMTDTQGMLLRPLVGNPPRLASVS